MHGLPSSMYSNETQSSSRFPVSPTPVPKPLSYRSYGKENGKSDLSAQPQHGRRIPSAPASMSHGYAAQTFLNPPTINNPLYNHQYARSFGGFSQHSQHSFSMTNAPMGYGNNFQEEFKPTSLMLQPQQPQGRGMGSNNYGYGDGMNYDM